MRDLAQLNINDGGRFVLRQPPSDETFADFEETFGISLPEGLKFLLRVANGGHPELDSVGGASGQYSVNRFYYLAPEDRGPESLWYAAVHWRPILGDRAVPFADDGGGNQFFLDLSDAPPSVKLCLHDEAMRVVLIAPSFEAFIDALDIDPDMI
jgi:hypothetical protein